MNQLNNNSEILPLQKENQHLRRAREELFILNEIPAAKGGRKDDITK